MNVIAIECSAYEELQTKFNKFVSEMKAMASREEDFPHKYRQFHQKPLLILHQ